jgi:hypothetical protein
MDRQLDLVAGQGSFHRTHETLGVSSFAATLGNTPQTIEIDRLGGYLADPAAYTKSLGEDGGSGGIIAVLIAQLTHVADGGAQAIVIPDQAKPVLRLHKHRFGISHTGHLIAKRETKQAMCSPYRISYALGQSQTPFVVRPSGRWPIVWQKEE